MDRRAGALVDARFGTGRSSEVSGSRYPLVYIVGSGRCGSTLLESILNQVDGFVTTGELSAIWVAIVENWQCGCGAPVVECSYWSEVIKRAFGTIDEKFARAMLRWQSVFDRPHYSGLMLMPGGTTALKAIARKKPYWNALTDLHAAAREVAKADFVVDSDKYPTHPVFFAERADVHIIHIVRDPRAVFYSWTRAKTAKYRTGALDTRGLLWGSFVWNILNMASAKLKDVFPGNYTLVRYEDLMAKPRETLSTILKDLGRPDDQLDFLLDGNQARLQPNHGIGGNPARLNTGAVKLKIDDEWKGAMPLLSRYAATMLCTPHMLRYGYGFHVDPSMVR
jgi:hypothetical protein